MKKTFGFNSRFGFKTTGNVVVPFPAWDGPDAFNFSLVSAAFNSQFIDAKQHTITTFGSLSGTAKWTGGRIALNKVIYMSPFDRSDLLTVDTATNTELGIGSFSGSNRYIGSVLAPNGAIYCIPWSASAVAKITTTGVAADLDFCLNPHFNKL